MDRPVELLGESPRIDAVRLGLRRLLERQRQGQRLPSVLIQGDTGTGKGLVARMLHRRGARAKAPFVDVNCAAIPDTLLEAELFGFERGAFTDAHRAKPGLFQAAHGGVLFLDEIGLLPHALQAKLLTAIEERAVRRLGSTVSEAADAWVISATNTDLKAAVRARKFREDLYHRLAVVTLELPPLRERGHDIVLLAERFLARTCEEYGLPPKRLEPAARDRLLAYSWPGNVRELANVMERAALFADGAVLTADALGIPASEALKAGQTDSELRSAPVGGRDELNQQRLLAALEATDWNISRTAVRLGVARNTVYARLQKFGLKAGPAELGATTPTSEDRHVLPPAMADSDLRWERRTVALLRAEICGADGVDASSLSSRALEAVVAKVESFGGRLEEMSPTGVVAAFGADSFDDAPRRAAHAALTIHRDGQRVRESGAAAATATIGVHVASVLIGRVGTRIEINAHDKRAHWPMLEALIRGREPAATFASSAAEPFLERRFDLTLVERDTEDSKRVYRLTGHERHGLGLWGTTTRFVGRHDELAALQTRLEMAASGQGQVMAILGEAGVGKSRLVFEFARSQHVGGCVVLETGSVSYGKGSSYLPVVGLLRRYFGIEDRDTHDAIRDHVARKLTALDPALGTVAPALLALLDTPTADAEWQRLEPSQRRRRIFDAVKRLLRRESERQSILVIFEDLHWLDSETQALLDSIVGSLPTMAALLVVTYRPEYQHTWASQSCYTQLRIDPLPADHTDELLIDLLGGDPTLGALRRLIADKTARNPLFIEESVRTLVETGVLRGKRGAYALAHSVDAIEVPATVQALLAARIDRLRFDDKRLLEIAAVIGKDIPLGLLAAIANETEDDVRDRLERLQNAAFLYEARVSADAGYTFKHALTHEVAYGSVPPERRRALHARIVAALETKHRDRLGEPIERLAHHALRGELWERAVHYLRQAGLKAAARSAYSDARAWLEQALSVLETLPASPSTLERGVDIRLELRPVLIGVREIRTSLERMREAEALAERLDDDRRRGQVYVGMTNAHAHLGELDEALVTGARALEIAGLLGDSTLRILATTYLEQVHYFRGEYERVIALATDNLASLPPDALDESYGAALPICIYDRYRLLQSFTSLGRFAEAAVYATQALRLAQDRRHSYTIGMVSVAVSYFHARTGDWGKARALIEHAIDAYLSENVFHGLAEAVAHLARVLAQLGEAREALARLREGEQLVERDGAMGYFTFHRHVYRSLGRAYLLLGRLDEARMLADRALEYAPPQPASSAHSLHLLADIAAHPDRFDPERGQTYYRQALTLAEPRGMRPLAADCHHGLGRLYRRTGKTDDASAHLTMATTMYREMGITYWLEKAEAELRAL